MSNRSKGSKYEIEFEELLISFGFTTQRVKGSTKWNKNVDFFGKWDITAFDDKSWLLVQVKTDYRKKVHKDLKEWFDKNKPPYTCAIYAIRTKGRRDRWRIIYIGQKGITRTLPIKEKRIKVIIW